MADDDDNNNNNHIEISGDNEGIFHPKCIASTIDDFNEPAQRKASLRQPGIANSRSNHFRRALFSADGTSIITFNDDNCLRTFVLPTDLLDGADEPKHLHAHDTWQSSSNIQSYALYPGFSLADPSTTVLLCGQVDVPITLRNALQYDPVLASYPNVNPLTESHHSPRSLAFSRDGQHFLAGSDSLLSVYDSTRSGQGPFLQHKLSVGRNSTRQQNSGHLKRGAPTCLAISVDGTLALGTDQREISFYSQDGVGAWTTSFELEQGLGSGVSDIKWSPDGRYLLVGERQSNVVQVYDIRNTQQKVSDLTGRYATTPQAMYLDAIQTATGYEIWAGGTDGTVRMWSNPGRQEDSQMPDAALQLHNVPVPSAVWHPSGAVLATAAGRRMPLQSIGEDSDEESDGDADRKHSTGNSLCIWTL